MEDPGRNHHVWVAPISSIPWDTPKVERPFVRSPKLYSGAWLSIVAHTNDPSFTCQTSTEQLPTYNMPQGMGGWIRTVPNQSPRNPLPNPYRAPYITLFYLAQPACIDVEAQQPGREDACCFKENAGTVGIGIIRIIATILMPY